MGSCISVLWYFESWQFTRTCSKDFTWKSSECGMLVVEQISYKTSPPMVILFMNICINIKLRKSRTKIVCKQNQTSIVAKTLTKLVLGVCPRITARQFSKLLVNKANLFCFMFIIVSSCKMGRIIKKLLKANEIKKISLRLPKTFTEFSFFFVSPNEAFRLLKSP